VKNIITIIALIYIFKTSLAQSPPGIPYQAIARTTTGEPYANGALQARFSLHEQTAIGNVSYAETHSLQTDAFGLFSTTFGAGTPITGTFAAINWGLTTKYLQVEINLGNSWIDMGTQQLMSVPYALYAGSTNNNTSVITPYNNGIGRGFSQISQSSTQGTLMESINYCFNLTEQGFEDWRLPTIEEVLSYATVNGVSNNMTFWTLSQAGSVSQSGFSTPFIPFIYCNGFALPAYTGISGSFQPSQLCRCVR
jgi:hypothetical protein